MSDAVAAIGAIITIDGTPIEEVGDISGFSFTTESIDVTSQDSPGHGREKIPGLKDWGTLGFPMNAVPGAVGQQALFDAWDEDPQLIHPFVVTYTNGVVVTANGFVSAFGPLDAALADANKLTVEITISEKPTASWGS